MLNKLVLGTANFGLDYGIANRSRLSREEIHNILEYARSHGVWGIDTAKAYGDAENIMGEYFTQYGKTFGVITKLPQKEYETTREIEDDIFESLKNMNIEHIDFVLLHSYETYKLYGKKIIPVLQSFSRDKVIGCYGVSVYQPENIALLFVIGKSWLDGVIVGVDSCDHLMSNIRICSNENLDTYKLIEPLIKDLAVYDEEIILPYRWQ